MKNISFFALTFLVCGSLTFGLSKTRQQDKLGDAILIGILGAGIGTYVFNGISNAKEEEEYINNNSTLIKIRPAQTKPAEPKLLSAGKNFHVTDHTQNDKSGFLDDVSETGFLAEREQLASKNVNNQFQQKK
jgi:hypothetical protein